jgi:type IV fimbrial biogenesis protein FimT
MRGMKTTQTGFTLIELMTGLLVLSILAALAAPSFREFTRESRTSAALNDLVAALALARSESLRRAVPVALCASTDGALCSGGSDWSDGWLVFTDTSGATGDLDGTDTLLQVFSGYPTDLVLNGGAGLTSVQYLPSGMINGAPASLSVATQGCTGQRARTVSIAVAGFVSSAKASC